MSSPTPDTRTRILQATWKLLEQQDGHGVRMTDIAAEASISRQAVYLHFATRAELLIATTRYLDEVKGVEERLAPSRAAISGTDRLDAFIAAWGLYIPEIYGVARGLLAVYNTDEDAANAWDQRMQAVREGCHAAIATLKKEKNLAQGWTVETATDLLWSMLSVGNWERLTQDCGWTSDEVVVRLQRQAKSSFIKTK